MAQDEKIACAYDSFANEAQPGTNKGDETRIRLRDDTGVRRWGYVYFPMDTIKMADATILDATLRLYHKGTNASSTITARRLTQRWKERKINWRNKPESVATGAGSATGGGSDKEFIDIDVTSICQAWVNGKAVLGFRLSTDSTSLKDFYSSEAAPRVRPRLFVEWTKPGETPTDLVPDGEQAVDAAAPLLTWEANTPTEVNIQIDTTDDFASPVYDSGWVESDDTAFDLATAGSPPSLSDDTTYFWRVRYREDSAESDWSEPAEFQRRTKGVVSITSPSTVVEDTTPEVTHTFTGRTQTAVQYILKSQEPGEAQRTIFDSGRTATTDLDFTLPSKISSQTVIGKQVGRDVVLIKSLTATYTIEVRVWDEFSRADRPTYAFDTQDFTFEEGAIDPVTNLDGFTRESSLVLTFNRTAVPDYFAVREDGKLIENRIEPADVNVGGTAYEIPIYSASPRTPHTYKIEAVVDDSGVLKHSTGNPTKSLTFNPTGIWLVREEDGLDVRLLGQERDVAVTSAIGETGTTFFIIGRPDPVRIVDQIRGLEGQVEGELISYAGRTAAEEKANFETLKEDPTGIYRLIWGSRNKPVILGESAVNGDPNTEEIYVLQFNFWQVGEFDIEVEDALS